MNKLAIFGLDGVLINTCTIHTTTLRKAVRETAGLEPSCEPYLDASDGLRTSDKLHTLQLDYNLTPEQIIKIDTLKEMYTLDLLNYARYNPLFVTYFQKIVNNGIKIAISSNMRMSYIKAILTNLGIYNHVSSIASGDAFVVGKPNIDMFTFHMKKFKVKHEDTIIFDDSLIVCESLADTKATIVVTNKKTLVTEIQLRRI